jgi:hypothetical protein
MNQVIEGRQSKGNSFTVHKVANGWLVQMPPVYNIPGSENPYAGLVPALREAIKMQNEDPLLSELRGEEEEENVQQILPIIGRDESLYVCKNFEEVLELLTRKFGNLKG